METVWRFESSGDGIVETMSFQGVADGGGGVEFKVANVGSTRLNASTEVTRSRRPHLSMHRLRSPLSS